MKRILTINSYFRLGMFMANIEGPIGEILRNNELPSPYAYSQTHNVYLTTAADKVIIVETKHRHFEVFKLDNEIVLPLERE